MLTTSEKLRIQFRKEVRHGFAKNAELDPGVPSGLQILAEAGEAFVVRVNSTKGYRYWFSDRRLLREESNATLELFRYDAIQRAQWMSRDITERRKREPEGISEMKVLHGDLVEVGLPEGDIVLEGMGQSYGPTLNFFWWLLKAKEKSSI
jgi:hypothetical protein